MRSFNTPRRLAAIMFTDIQGYTSLMQKNEVNALILRNRHREAFKKFHLEFDGEILQYYGDGTLSIFSSSVQAVNCAISIQQEMLKFPLVPLRIGIHLGDIIKTDEEIIGDAVNLASRIESLAVPGSVLISQRVQNQLKNHTIETRSLGSFHLKNVSQPARIFAVKAKGINVPTSSQLMHDTLNSTNYNSLPRAPIEFLAKWMVVGFIAAIAGAGIYFSLSSSEKNPKLVPVYKAHDKSVAVLPFFNLSGDPDQEYFAIGMMDEIHNQLCKIQDLYVPSRTTSMKYRDQTRSILEIGKELRVQYVIEGSVRKTGQQIRVAVKLIDVKSDTPLWSEMFDRKLDPDIFQLQTRIARKVATHLAANLTEVESQLINTAPTRNMEAYELYLRGREQLWFVQTPGSNTVAMDYFRRAIKKDSTYALAYKGLASCMVRQSQVFGQDFSWITDSAWVTLNKGLSYDKENPGLIMLQVNLLAHMGKYHEAERVLDGLTMILDSENEDFIAQKFVQCTRRGALDCMMEWAVKWIECRKDKENSLWTFVNIYNWLGEFSRVKVLLEDADENLKLNNLFELSMAEGNFDEAQRYVSELMKINPYKGLMESGEVAIRMEDYEKTVLHLEKAIDQFPSLIFPGQFNRSIYTLLGFVYIQNGEIIKARELLNVVRKSNMERIMNGDQNMKYAYDLASGYAAQGDADEAIFWLEDARNKGFNRYWQVENDPIFDSLQSSPKFHLVLFRMKDYIKNMRKKANLMEDKMWLLQPSA